jgi:hypothetical protein
MAWALLFVIGGTKQRTAAITVRFMKGSWRVCDDYDEAGPAKE